MGKQKKFVFVPFTPSGSMLAHLEASNEAKAISNLMKEIAHMPYPDWDAAKRRGYHIERFEKQGF